MNIPTYAVPERVSHILQIVIEGGFYAASDIYRLSLIYQYNWRELISAICLDVWTHRTILPDVCDEVLQIAQEYWKEERYE